MFRWKADHASAAFEFCAAAQCFRAARQIGKSKECFLKAAECHKKTGAIFHSARCIESAILVAKGDMPCDEIMSFATEAASLYQQHGSGDSAAVLLAKAARLLEDHHADLAYKLYELAADASITSSSQHQGLEYLNKSSRLLVQLCWLDQAVDSIRRELAYQNIHSGRGLAGRLTVALVLVQIARGDVIAAEKSFKEWGGFCEGPEVHTIEQLLQAYDDNDPEAAKRALASPFIRHMDVEYSRLAATIVLPKGVGASDKPAQNDAPSGSGQAAAAGAAQGATVAVSHVAAQTEELC